MMLFIQRALRVVWNPNNSTINSTVKNFLKVKNIVIDTRSEAQYKSEPNFQLSA